MYAIVDIAGQQFKVKQGEEIFVHRLEGDTGAQLGFPKVMLIENEGKSIIGTPVIEGAEVKVTILEHLRADKLFVFKKKRRKGYQKLNGHRQYLSRVRVDQILEEGGSTPVRVEVKKAAPSKKVAVTEKKAGEELKPAAKPAVKPVAKSVAKPAAKPAAKAAAKTAAKAPAKTAAKAAAKPAAKPRASKKKSTEE